MKMDIIGEHISPFRALQRQQTLEKSSDPCTSHFLLPMSASCFTTMERYCILMMSMDSGDFRCTEQKICLLHKERFKSVSEKIGRPPISHSLSLEETRISCYLIPRNM